MVPEEPVFIARRVSRLRYAPVELMESLLFVLGPMLDQLLTSRPKPRLSPWQALP